MNRGDKEDYSYSLLREKFICSSNSAFYQKLEIRNQIKIGINVMIKFIIKIIIKTIVKIMIKIMDNCD